MQVLILSDIHGNREALQSVLDMVSNRYEIDACILLGDLIDYGMHSNETVAMIRELPYPCLCNIWGNHEHSIICEDYGRFSSERGQACAKYTKSVLDSQTLDYVKSEMKNSGHLEFECAGRKCLAVHGSLSDEYWRSIAPDQALEEYSRYDYVFSGHSHRPHFFEKYTPVNDARNRNQKKTIFVNPGSVGQPRNLNSYAQFAVLHMEQERIVFEKAEYDIRKEQSAYQGQVDDFYRERLERGI